MSFSPLSAPEFSSRRIVIPCVLAVLATGAFVGCGKKNGVAEFEAGRAAYESGDLKKAEAQLLKSERCNATNVDTQVLLALVDLRKGALSSAEKHVLLAEELAGADPDVRLLGAQIAWHTKNYEKALSLYRALADDAALGAEMQARAWTGLGIVEATTDRYDLARVAFLRAIRLDRRNAAAHYHLGHLYRYAPFAYSEAALEQFEIFVRLSGEADARVQKTQRAIIPGLKETIAQAATEIKGASTRNSAASVAAISRAEAAWKKGSFKQSATAYAEAYAADPLAYAAALGLARCQLKNDASPAGQKKALASYRKACALRPGAVSTLIEAGQLAEKLNQIAQAREIYSRAVAANPASLDALDGLIRAFRKAGETKMGAEYLAYRNTISTPVRR